MSMSSRAVTVYPTARVRGRVRLPGDKSISHRYALLGALAGQLRGHSWDEAVRREILSPLGMTRTTLRAQAPHAGGFAVHPWADVMQPEPAEHSGHMAPAGDLWSTADDLCRLTAFLLAGDDRVLPAAALPLLGLAGGIYLTLQPGLAAWGAVPIVASLAIAPFAWRVLGPVAARFLGPAPRSRIKQLTEIQADVTKTQAVELERIERGLHDGAQARIVALGMAMGAVERLLDTDPEKARPIIAGARASAAEALTELRDLARGINPPVLSERGLVDAVRALALDAPVPVSVLSSLPSRPERPVEAAVYFAVAELLANVGKHAHATRATVELGYADKTLAVTVTDDGQGGAAGPATGSGLNGIERRLAAFGGRVAIDSPAGGPTRITLGIPCVLS